MPWGVKTLKIIGDGLVQKSDLTSFEFPLGHYEDFIVIDKKNGEIIKVVTFPTFLRRSFLVRKMIFTLCIL
jgi:hypothetical protein